MSGELGPVRERRLLRRALTGILLLVGCGGCVLSQGPGTDHAALLVPLYTYPDATWELLLRARADHPRVRIVAIMNPASGPGKAPDPKYISWIAKLRKARVVLLGYVTTSYAKKAIGEINEEIDRWQKWYRPDGIFYDEMAYEPGSERYYRELDRYAKSKGFGPTIGNPGTETRESYVGSLDTIILYENAGLPPLETLGGWHAHYPPTQWGVLPYAVPAVDRTFLREASRHVGYLCLTDRTHPDPWDLLSTYFLELVRALDQPD